MGDNEVTQAKYSILFSPTFVRIPSLNYPEEGNAWIIWSIRWTCTMTEFSTWSTTLWYTAKTCQYNKWYVWWNTNVTALTGYWHCYSKCNLIGHFIKQIHFRHNAVRSTTIPLPIQSECWQTHKYMHREVLIFVDRFTALHFMVTGVWLALRHI